MMKTQKLGQRVTSEITSLDRERKMKKERIYLEKAK
jgi:hypothetical protein